MGLRVRAVVLFEFQCPKCKGWYPESNPLECPHQNGRGVTYKPAKGDKIINVAAMLRKLGLDETRVKRATQVHRRSRCPCRHLHRSSPRCRTSWIVPARKALEVRNDAGAASNRVDQDYSDSA